MRISLILILAIIGCGCETVSPLPPKEPKLPRIGKEGWYSSPTIMVPVLTRYQLVSRDMAAYQSDMYDTRPTTFQNPVAVELEYNRLSMPVKISIRDLDESKGGQECFIADQPDNLTPFYSLRIPQRLSEGKTAFVIDVIAFSRVTGYLNEKNILVSLTDGSVEYDPTKQMTEAQQLRAFLDKRKDLQKQNK